MVIVLSVLLMIIGAFGAWYYFIRKRDSEKLRVDKFGQVIISSKSGVRMSRVARSPSTGEGEAGAFFVYMVWFVCRKGVCDECARK